MLTKFIQNCFHTTSTQLDTHITLVTKLVCKSTHRNSIHHQYYLLQSTSMDDFGSPGTSFTVKTINRYPYIVLQTKLLYYVRKFAEELKYGKCVSLYPFLRIGST